MKASDLFVKCLEEENVEYIFGVPGEENADFEFGVLLFGALPGGDKGAGFEHELACGSAIGTLALAGPLAEPTADIEPILLGDRFHPLGKNIDQYGLRSAGGAVLVTFFVREVTAR